MINKYACILTGMIGFCLLTGGNPLSAEETNRWDEIKAKKQEMMEKIFQELNLTEEQQKLIEEKRNALKEGQSLLSDKIKEKRTALKNEMEREGVTKAEIDSLADELIGLISQRIKLRIDGIWATKEILSPEQFKTFQEKKSEFRSKYRMHRNKKGGES